MNINIRETVEYLNEFSNNPKIGIILGSGLGELANIVEEEVRVEYPAIPNFPLSTVKGHGGELIFGKLSGVDVVLLSGRFHFYEGYSMKEVVYPVTVMKQLGVETLIVSNACGGINRDLYPGALMVIDDFINAMGTNPLMGKNDENLGPRFVDMTEPYSNKLQKLAFRAAKELNIELHKGVYAGFMGPYYETRAEIRMFESMGADTVGMSTVPETIQANYLGMDVLGISMVTNMATGIQTMKHSHDNVVKVANEAGNKFVKLILDILPKI